MSVSAFEERAWLKQYPHFVRPELDYGDVSLNDVYTANLEKYPDRNATWFFGRSMTFRELDIHIRAAAAGLKALGVRRGDHVALALPNCPQHVVAYMAILRLGAVAVEHNPLYTVHELTAPVIDHGARIAIVWDKAAGTFHKLRRDTQLETLVSVNMIEAMPRHMQLALKLPFGKLKEAAEQLHAPAPDTLPWSTLLDAGLGGDGSDLEPAGVDKHDPALVMYTSGTTGSPKGAQLTHHNLHANITQAREWLDVGHDREVMVAALPFFHAYGMTTSLIPAFELGAEIVILPSPKIDLILDAITKRPDITWITGVPTLWERLIPAAKERGVDLSNMRYTFSGAASMSPELLKNWQEQTGSAIIEGYGLTECSPIVIGTPVTGPRPGYIGLPFPDTLVRVADPENLSATMPDGEDGELLVKGPQVMKGYLNKPEETDEAFHEGWLRTGDHGIMEEDGWIKLTGRSKEMISTGGFNVYPGEVEEALARHPSIKAASVVGRTRADGSETVVAAVELADGVNVLDEESVKDTARTHVARYKVPREFHVVDELPTNIMGKTLRREVRERLAGNNWQGWS